MAAPTPVSSLVHSSTLVTAGYLLVYLSFPLHLRATIHIFLTLTLTTLLFSSLASFSEMDSKKLVALSTLSQVGLLSFCLASSLLWVSVFHMLTHAIFKSSLFISLGLVLHESNGTQDFRLLSPNQRPALHSTFSMCVLGLASSPFSAGFYRKESILSHTRMLTYLRSGVFILAAVRTIVYSKRLLSLVPI